MFLEYDSSQNNIFNDSGGPNTDDIETAQMNYVQFGACNKIHVNSVRKPTNEDEKDPDWEIGKHFSKFCQV